MTNVMEHPQEQRGGRRAPLSIGVVVGVVLTVGIAALIAQNTTDVSVHWLTLDGQQPFRAVLAITAIAGVVLAKLVAFVWHHRDRKA
jgi:uncharacterized integral membrane protein